jgi:hypothetical protein
MSIKTDFYFPSMSKNENPSSASLFESRKFFYDKTIPFIISDDYLLGSTEDNPNNTTVKIPLSDLYNQNALYGIIDTVGDVILPKQDINFFESVGFDKNKKELYLQDFVAKALSDMKEYLNKQILRNCFSLSGGNLATNAAKNSPFYNLTVKKAYTVDSDINNLYRSSATIIGSKFKNYVIANRSLNSSIVDHKVFTKKYIEFLKMHLSISPITKSRTTCFYNFKTFSNGLTFSISEDDAGNDELIYNKYYLDVAFFTFANACVRFGFRIDKNSPFILHADLSSPAMTEYYKMFNLTGQEDVFKKRYEKVYKNDLDALKFFFIDSYNIFVHNNALYNNDLNNACSGNSRTNTFGGIRNPITNNKDFLKDFPDTYWIRLYVYFKNLELQAGFSQQQFEWIVTNANNFVKVGKKTEALSLINSYFNELKGVTFYDALLPKNGVVQQSSAGFGSAQPEIIF